MNKLVSLIILLVGIAVYAFTRISQEMEYFEIAFPITEELKGRTIPIDSAMFRYPYRLEVRGDN